MSTASGGNEGGGETDDAIREKIRDTEAWFTVRNGRRSGGREDRGRGSDSERGRGAQGPRGRGGDGRGTGNRPRGAARGTRAALPASDRTRDRGSRPGSERGANPSELNPSMTFLRRKWQAEGRCLKCGSESHYRKNCDANSANSATASNPSSRDSSASRFTTPAAPTKRGDNTDSASAANRTIGHKQRRTASVTGLTPPSKRTYGPPEAGAASYAVVAAGSGGKKAKYSYAEAAAGSPELVAVTREELRHIPRSKYLEIQKALSADHLKNCREGNRPIKIEATGHDHSAAWWKLQNEESALRARAIISMVAGIECMTRAELQEKRRPVCILSGLVRGQVTASLTKDELKLILKMEVREKQIEGRVELASAQETPNGNLIVRILVDDVGEASLAVWANTLHFGVDGKVLFKKVSSKKPKPESAALCAVAPEAAALNAAAMEGIEDTSTMSANVTLNSAVSQLSIPERMERMKRIEEEKEDILAILQGKDLETSMHEMMNMPREKRLVLREAEELQRQQQQRQQQQLQSPERQADAPPHQSTPLLKRSDSTVTIGSMSMGMNKVQLATEIAES